MPNGSVVPKGVAATVAAVVILLLAVVADMYERQENSPSLGSKASPEEISYLEVDSLKMIRSRGKH